MNRADFHAMRAAMRLAQHQLANNIRHDEMADSRLMVQIDSYAETVIRLRARITAIRQQLPVSRDPLGFRVMHQNWMRRRSHVLARVRAEAGRAGDGDRFIRVHALYMAHIRRASQLRSIAA